MRKLIFPTLLLCLVCGVCAAQSNDPFDYNKEYFTRSFTVKLKEGNEMKIELKSLSDIQQLYNLDSIVALFIQSIQQLQKELDEDIAAHRIDFLINGYEGQQLKLTKHNNNNTKYLVSDGQVSLLKTSQDTIVIVGKIPSEKANSISPNYKVSFYINHLDDLAGYKKWMLNDKVKDVEASTHKKWKRLETEGVRSNNYSDIYANVAYGIDRPKVILNIGYTASIQNYADKFLPAIRFNFDLFLKREKRIHQISFFQENPFVYYQNADDQRLSFKNIFIGLNYSFINREDLKKLKPMSFVFPYLTTGVLVKRDGNFFDRRTFQVGVSKVNLFNNLLTIEPIFFISKKNVDPSIKLSVTIL